MNSSTNALKKIEESSGLLKIPYGIFLILGILFWVASISTLYSLFQILDATNWSLGIAQKTLVLQVMYIALNFIAGYGILFCRSWVLWVFSLNTILMAVVGVFLYASRGVFLSSTLSAGTISLFFFLLLYLFRKRLVVYRTPTRILSLYILILLVTLYMTYFF